MKRLSGYFSTISLQCKRDLYIYKKKIAPKTWKITLEIVNASNIQYEIVYLEFLIVRKVDIIVFIVRNPNLLII